MSARDEVQETAATNLAPLLEDRDGAVVTLVAGETRLVAHRAVLTARSPVFEAMFRHDTVEAGSGQVVVADVEGPVLSQLLAYLYTLQAPQLPSMARQLLVAADKYGLSGLKAECERQAAAQLAVENAAATAVLAVRHCCPVLTEAAVKFIRAYNFQVMATQGWVDAVRTQHEDVVKLCQLLAETPAETSSAPAAAKPGPTASTQQSSQTSVADAPSAAPDRVSLPKDAAALQLRVMPEEIKQELAARLLEAAADGAAREVWALLAAGAPKDSRDGEGNTALHLAAGKGHARTVKVLLDGGLDVNATNSSKQTPLHRAAVNRGTHVIWLLVAASARVDAQDGEGSTPLHVAARQVFMDNGRYKYIDDAVHALLIAGARNDIKNVEGKTPETVVSNSANGAFQSYKNLR